MSHPENRFDEASDPPRRPAGRGPAGRRDRPIDRLIEMFKSRMEKSSRRQPVDEDDEADGVEREPLLTKSSRTEESERLGVKRLNRRAAALVIGVGLVFAIIAYVFRPRTPDSNRELTPEEVAARRAKGAVNPGSADQFLGKAPEILTEEQVRARQQAQRQVAGLPPSHYVLPADSVLPNGLHPDDPGSAYSAMPVPPPGVQRERAPGATGAPPPSGQDQRTPYDRSPYGPNGPYGGGQAGQRAASPRFQAYYAALSAPPQVATGGQAAGSSGRGLAGGSAPGEAEDPDIVSQRRYLDASTQALETYNRTAGSQQPGSAYTPYQQTLAAMTGQPLSPGQAPGQTSGAPGVTASGYDTPGNNPPSGGTGSADNRWFGSQAAQAGRDDYIATGARSPISTYEVHEGTVIPALLMVAINSDLPGLIMAQVSQNVYDSRTQRVVLIPKGTRLIGTYNDQVAVGQDRLMLAWTRMIFPDGRSITLPGLQAGDERGASGLRDQVDNHYFRVFSNAILVSLISAAVGSTTPPEAQGPIYPGQAQTPEQAFRISLSQQIQQLSLELTKRDLNRKPTLKIKEGFPLNVFVSGDMAFPTGRYRNTDGYSGGPR